MSSSESYGQKIVRLRKAKGWTQDELAERSGVAKRTLQDVEGDKRARPQRATRVALNAALGVEGDAEDERQSWPKDVEVFLDIMGAWLTTMDEEARLDRIGKLVREIVTNNT